MKKIKLIPYISVVIFALLLTTSCNKEITDFGFDGSISGKLLDQNGNIVAGDITSSGLAIHALGEGDAIAMIMRVKGDGTFANNKLYPKVYTVWVEGPVISEQEIIMDLTGNKSVAQDLIVSPFLTVNTPVINGSATSSEIKVDYSIIENDGYTAESIEIYCSTIPYPTRNTGSGPFYHTKKIDLSDLQGTASISELSSGTKYFIRIGAKADGSNIYNFSDQIIVITP